MKILVLQLARLGDIYMSWPALRALRRSNPDAEIQFLVRPRFEAATRGLEVVNSVRALPTEEFLAPLAQDQAQDQDAINRVDYYLQGLRAEKYDRIINFSFSPLSSWIVKAISHEKTEVIGYTRHDDGPLKIADDVSAFFYAQVGTDRPNRIHLTDLFATMINADLIPADWRAPQIAAKDFALPKDYIVLHVGASEGHKRIAPFQWARALKHFHDLRPSLPIVTIGSASETGIVNEIRANLSSAKLIDLTGQTSVDELFPIIAGAKLMMGADSAPIHMASLTGTPTLNVSTGAVNFWETGPKSPKAWIFSVSTAADFSSETLGQAMAQICSGQNPESLIRHVGGVPAYETPRGFRTTNDFTWKLIQALYLGLEFPVTEEMIFVEALEKMSEMNQVVLEQLHSISAQSERLGPLLDRADEVLDAIGQLMPAAAVLARWVRTEKTRIPPGSREQVMACMIEIHSRLANVLMLYSLDAKPVVKGKGHGAV